MESKVPGHRFTIVILASAAFKNLVINLLPELEKRQQFFAAAQDHRVLLAASQAGYISRRWNGSISQDVVFLPLRTILDYFYPEGMLSQADARKLLHTWVPGEKLVWRLLWNIPVILERANLSSVPKETLNAVIRDAGSDDEKQLRLLFFKAPMERRVSFEVGYDTIILGLEYLRDHKIVWKLMEEHGTTDITIDMYKAALSNKERHGKRRMFSMLLKWTDSVDAIDDTLLCFAAKKGAFYWVADKLRQTGLSVDIQKLPFSKRAISGLRSEDFKTRIERDESLKHATDMLDLLVLNGNLESLSWFLEISGTIPQPNTLLSALKRACAFEFSEKQCLVLLDAAPDLLVADEVLMEAAKSPLSNGEDFWVLMRRYPGETFPPGFWSTVLSRPSRVDSILKSMLQCGLCLGIEQKDLLHAAEADKIHFECLVDGFLGLLAPYKDSRSGYSDNDPRAQFPIYPMLLDQVYDTTNMDKRRGFLKDLPWLNELIRASAQNGIDDLLEYLIELSSPFIPKQEFRDITSVLNICRGERAHQLAVLDLQSLVSKTVPCDLPDASSRTPLSWASNPVFSKEWDPRVRHRSLGRRRGVLESISLDFMFFNQKKVIDILHKAGVDLESRDTSKGWTPLTWAAHGFQHMAVEALINAGADICARSDKGESAVSIARESGHILLADELEEKTKQRRE